MFQNHPILEKFCHHLKYIKSHFSLCNKQIVFDRTKETYCISKKKSRKAEIWHIRFFIYQNPCLGMAKSLSRAVTKYCVEVCWAVTKYQVEVGLSVTKYWVGVSWAVTKHQIGVGWAVTKYRVGIGWAVTKHQVGVGW